jgi:GAF domain-containing protein
VTITGSEMVLAPDLTKDERFRDFPSVVGHPHFRFYCGVPLITDDGHALGALCVVDFKPRELTVEQQESLRRLARQVMGLLEHRRSLIELDRVNRELAQARDAIAAEKARSEALLANILPRPIAEELKRKGKVEPAAWDYLNA